MTADSPPPHAPEPPPPPPSSSPPKRPLTAREQYNIVSDNVTGVNVRLKDNLFQGLAILIFLIAGILAGALLTPEPLAGALIGALGGLIAGVLISGVALMIYRGVRHLQSRHD